MKRDILWRVYLSFLGIVMLSLVVLGKVFYIQHFQGDYWSSMSDSLHQRIEEIDAGRGTIYSEDGQMLSTSLPTFDIYIDFMADGLREKNGKRFKDNIDSFSIALANYFADRSAASYKADLQLAYKNKIRYYPLKKKLLFEEYKTFRDFPLARLGRNRSGVIVEENSKRLMPFGLLANRTIGLSREYIASNGKAKKQNVGIEKSYDSLLTGQKGQRLVRFIAGGVAVPVDGYQVEPENGKDIITTLDVNMQDITGTALRKMMLQSEAQYGTAIVMEIKTGKIKAIANLGRHPDGSYFEDDNYALRVTEPGSTIKLATLLSVLEKKSSAINDLVEVGNAGRMPVGPRIVNDAERSPKSVLKVIECFSHSSNVGMSKLAYKAFGNDPKKFKEYLHKYFLDVKSPIDLTDIPAPRLAPLEKKSGGVMNMVTMSFGYAIQVSPLHILTLYNAVANDGKMMKPYLVNRIERDGIPYREFQPTVLDENICSPSTAKAARESMEAVIIEGTGRNAFKNMPFAVAGKTGTAHVADGKIKYSDMVYQASFAGYFPANDPQYSCIVVIRTRPHAAQHYGGQLAAPVFREIATKLYAIYVNRKTSPVYEVKKDSSVYYYTGYTGDIKNVYQTLNIFYYDSVKQANWSAVYAGNFLQNPAGHPILKERNISSSLMPDIKGLGLKDAVYLLENMGLKVQAKGKGKVLAQSIQAGTALAKGMTVFVELG
ncbi:MAG TPA: penicillin-binding protein [Chitinophagaceae bacterium]|nr:penicillin-binding protein [Chitinophagaceae bacterium]